MSESRLAVQPAQTQSTHEAAPEARNDDLRQLTELELMLTGGGDVVSPWP
jgi:hypothetical protein